MNIKLDKRQRHKLESGIHALQEILDSEKEGCIFDLSILTIYQNYLLESMIVINNKMDDLESYFDYHEGNDEE